MKYFIIAGEASGDLHGASLISAIKRQDPLAIFHAWGGNKMEQAGATIHTHIDKLSFFGLWAVLLNLHIILRHIKQCKKDIATFQPDIVIGIDYPGFNLKMLKWAKKNGYKTVQYVLPHIWVWKENRIELLKKYIDRVLVILPFEQSFCAARGLDTTYIGHPLLEYWKDFRLTHNNSPEKKDIVIFPGSRPSEIKLFLPILLGVAKHFPNERFCIMQVSHLSPAYYHHLLVNAPPNVHLIIKPAFQAMQSAKAAIVKSGTSTLEVALTKVPFVVVYKMNWFNSMFKFLLNIKFASLPNIIMDKEIVKELLQSKFNEKNVVEELTQILTNPSYQANIQKEFDILEQKLFFQEPASVMATKAIMKVLHS